MFDDLDDYDDDFEESGASKGAGGDFNANELLNFSDYQNRRRETANKSGALNIKDVLNGSAAQKLYNNQYDGEIEVDDDWGDDWGDEDEDEVKEVDKKMNLNKLSDAELAKHKRAMDKDFNVNQLKPGDTGYQYDKVVDFGKGRDSPLGEDSWGEESDGDADAQDEEAGEEDEMRDYGEDDDDMDYFDDDFS